MSPISFLSVAALLLSTVTATFIEPTEKASWNLNSANLIRWETGGLQAPLKMHLCPGGAKDISNSIQLIAPSIPNTGSWNWYPSAGIKRHETFTIIIIDSRGHYQYSPYFYMSGWEKYTHLTTIIHSTSMHVTTSVYKPPPMHTPPPMMHDTIIIEPPVIVTSIIEGTMRETSLVETIILETSIMLHTSVIQPPPSVHIMPVLVTSQPAPILKTIVSPPMIETQVVAPILVTEIQMPLTKVITQAPIMTTVYQQPIVKTILVTETPPPIVKEISRPPLTIIETRAPIIMTKSQAPIVTTIIHPPKVVTEYVAPIVFTQHVTEIVSLAPIYTVITEYFTMPVHETFVSLISVHSSMPVYTPPPVYMPPPVYTPPPAMFTSVVVSSPPPAPIFQNNTSVELPEFQKPTSISQILARTTSLSVTTPRALPISSTGAAASTGFGVFPEPFTGDAGRKVVTNGRLASIGLAVLAVWIL